MTLINVTDPGPGLGKVNGIPCDVLSLVLILRVNLLSGVGSRHRPRFGQFLQ